MYLIKKAVLKLILSKKVTFSFENVHKNETFILIIYTYSIIFSFKYLILKFLCYSRSDPCPQGIIHGTIVHCSCHRVFCTFKRKLVLVISDS